ncbi:hypothetical protein BOTCAL_0427g00080 [Botryotinia calthae]|uniref:Delta(24)-sterol reductase n=1 Tax=Botryotinia calthae TaxID=38488 RepID=A0A4Y8CP02_9HELO|nr:hypothetical protein BOTCAL_0427g00080 [Botryotinia calthae]
MDRHDEAVSIIASSVKQFYERKEAFRLYHGSTNSTRDSNRRRDRMVDTSRLDRVLKVDTEKRTVLVEPNVPMDSLVTETLRYGLVPPVVMEFPGITTGGGFAGTSGESSSFKYGFFDRTVNWIEMVLANGEIVSASKDVNSDLFYGAASSFGTLGVTTLIELQLIEAKTYVELTYINIQSMAQGIQKIEEISKDPNVDYLDGILFSKEAGVICSGRLVDERIPNTQVQCFTRNSDPWFYLHAKKVHDKSSGSVTEMIPLVDYLFRYDRGGFWVARYAFRYFITPFNHFTRRLLDYFMHTRVMYHALHQSGLSKKYIIQDVAIPYPRSTEFVEYLDKDFGQWPIWLCPLRQSGISSDSPLGLLAERKENSPTPNMLLNFGVWGPGPNNRDAFVSWNRKFEHKVRELGGQKWLYAHAYYTEKEFDEIYNRKEYDALRAKYYATHLPSIYDKVKVDIDSEQEKLQASWSLWLLAIFWSIWPLGGLYGVYKAFLGGDYLLPKVHASSKTRKSKD